MTATATPTDMDVEHIARLNSATKYPSIPTYHQLGDKGRLTEERTADFGGRPLADLEVTEKIDGTNARLIIPPRDRGAVVVGSRTELLHYADDLIHNPAQGIVDAVRHLLEPIRDALACGGVWTVVYGEVYGHGIGRAARNYTTTGRTGFAVFDIALVEPDVLEWSREQIAAWRDDHGQTFVSTGALDIAASALDTPLRRVPALALPGGPPPASVSDTHDWLRGVITATCGGLDDDATGRAEGVVVRTVDRTHIAKIRFEDYERTARAAGQT